MIKSLLTPENVDDVKLSGGYFIDTNILMFMYGPNINATDTKSRVYAKLLKRISEGGHPTYVDYLVLAEFANRYVRDIYNKRYKTSYPNFKDFRKTHLHADLVNDLSDEIYHISNLAERINCDTTQIDLDRVLEVVGLGYADFNDLLILEICQMENLTLITDDADCFISDVDILTANRKAVTSDARANNSI